MPFGWEDLPWHVLNPLSVEELPTYHLAEYSSFALCGLALLHVLLRGDVRACVALKRALRECRTSAPTSAAVLLPALQTRRSAR
jgi:hypothetical protein